jgi:methionyl aminopeptidase
MVVSNDAELTGLKEIGRICGQTLKKMADAMEPGMTTAELDAIGRKLLEEAGAQSAPETAYQFPGATCISVNEEVAHGIPGSRVLKHGDLVNIDVSAVKDGYYGDTGASYFIPPAQGKIDRLCRDGKRALWAGLNQVKAGRPYAKIGEAIGAFAARNKYTLIRNLASHGVGRSLHEEPTELATWPDRSERRIIGNGQVFTVEPFLSLGAEWSESGDDPWTLYSDPKALTVQFEHTLVATRNGAIILTLAE